MLEEIFPFIVSFLIGFLIGIERERSHPPSLKSMGVRTFSIIAIMGTLSAFLKDPIWIAVLSAFVFAMIILGYWRSTRKSQPQLKDVGITTELSAGLVYCLGFLTFKDPLLAGILGAALLLILVGRGALHRFSRYHLKSTELQATAILLAIAFGILTFLPDRTIDPWQIINPKRLGILFLAIASIQFGGYVAIRLFGDKIGILLSGFFGGLVSSTAVFLHLPNIYQERKHILFPIANAGTFATIAMIVEILIIIFLASTILFQAVLWPLMGMIFVGIITGIGFPLEKLEKSSKHKKIEEAEKAHEIVITPSTNPLDLKSVLKLVLFLFIMLTLIAITSSYLGKESAALSAFIGGLFEIHGVTFAIATLFAQNKLSLPQAEYILSLGIFGSFISKLGIMWILARNRLAVISSIFLILMMIGGITTFLLLK